MKVKGNPIHNNNITTQKQKKRMTSLVLRQLTVTSYFFMQITDGITSPQVVFLTILEANTDQNCRYREFSQMF